MLAPFNSITILPYAAVPKEWMDFTSTILWVDREPAELITLPQRDILEGLMFDIAQTSQDDIQPHLWITSTDMRHGKALKGNIVNRYWDEEAQSRIGSKVFVTAFDTDTTMGVL
jgi:hypothetical protein